jgi:hypothetical protein
MNWMGGSQSVINAVDQILQKVDLVGIQDESVPANASAGC